MTLSVHSLDVWGNAHDGYDVNDVYPSSGTITVPIDATDDEVIAALKSSIRIDGEPECGLFVEYAPTCHPEYELRPGIVTRQTDMNASNMQDSKKTPDGRPGEAFTFSSDVPRVAQGRYRDWYNGREILIRPRRYGNMGVQWEAYLADEHDYPGEFLGSGATRLAAIDAAHDALDDRADR